MADTTSQTTPQHRELDAAMRLGPSLTPPSAPELVREAYCAGYQDAVDSLRRWAEQFAAEPLQGVFHHAANMIEMAKPK